MVLVLGLCGEEIFMVVEDWWGNCNRGLEKYWFMLCGGEIFGCIFVDNILKDKKK